MLDEGKRWSAVPILAEVDVIIVSTAVIIDAIVTGVQRHRVWSRLSFSLAVWSGKCLLGAQSQHGLPHRVVENLKDDANEGPHAGTGPWQECEAPDGYLYHTRL